MNFMHTYMFMHTPTDSNGVGGGVIPGAKSFLFCSNMLVLTVVWQ